MCLYEPGIVTTQTGRYIFLIGGYKHHKWKDRTQTRDIYIVNTKDMKLRKSQMQLPIPSINGLGIVMSQGMNDDLIVHGYFRHKWRKRKYRKIRYSPYYLIQIIVRYYQNETLHVFQEDRTIWMANVHDIVNA